MNIRQSLTKGLVGIVLACASFMPSNISASEKNIYAPKYSLSEVPPLHCSRYVKVAAKDLFKKEYVSADAWNLKYHNDVVTNVVNGNIEHLIDSGILKEGMVVGIYNPKSSYNSKKDEKGKSVGYTHVALYLGKEGPNAYFAHQFGKDIFLQTPQEIKAKGLVFKEILDSSKR